MRSQISNLKKSIGGKILEYSKNGKFRSQFDSSHDGPLFAEVNSSLFDLLKQVKTISRVKLESLQVSQRKSRETDENKENFEGNFYGNSKTGSENSPEKDYYVIQSHGELDLPSKSRLESKAESESHSRMQFSQNSKNSQKSDSNSRKKLEKQESFGYLGESNVSFSPFHKNNIVESSITPEVAISE